MKHTYTSKYEVVETFKVTDQQAIYIGMELSEDGIPVVINHVKNPKFVEVLKREPLMGVLNNLVDTEILEDEVVLITKVMEADPLLVYLEENYIPIEGRMNLALSYLQEIVKYDHLEGATKNILIDEAQLVVQEGKIVFDELYLINEVPEEVDMNYLSNKISTVLEKIIYFEYRNLQKEEVLLREVHQFMFDLKNNTKFNNFYEIAEEFRKLYIYHLCVESIVEPAEKVSPIKRFFSSKKMTTQDIPEDQVEEIAESIDSIESNIEEKRSRRDRKSPQYKSRMARVIPLATVMVVLVGIGVYGLLDNGYISTVFNKITSEENQQLAESLPIAYFTLEEKESNWHFTNGSKAKGDENNIEEYLWEVVKEDEVITSADSKDLILSFDKGGEYVISLKVKDRHNQWSEKYSKRVTVDLPKEEKNLGNGENLEEEPVEKDEKYASSLKGTVSEDTTVSREKGTSWRIEAGDDDPKIVLNVKDDVAYHSMSFWIKSNSVNQIEINIKGYNNQGTLKYLNKASHSVKIPDRWEMVSLPLNSEELKEVLLEFTSFQNPFWVADLELDTLK